MTKFARFEGNNVLEVYNGDVTKAFHPSIASQFVEVPDEVEAGYTKNGNNFTAPPAAEEIDPADLPPVAPNYTGYNEVEFIQYVQTVSQMSDEQLLAFYDDTSVPMRTLRLKLSKLGDYRLTPANPVVLDGLDKLVTADYISSVAKDAILNNWPTT